MKAMLGDVIKFGQTEEVRPICVSIRWWNDNDFFFVLRWFAVLQFYGVKRVLLLICQDVDVLCWLTKSGFIEVKYELGMFPAIAKFLVNSVAIKINPNVKSV